MFLLLPPKSIKKYCFVIFSGGIKKTIGWKWISKYRFYINFFLLTLVVTKEQTYLSKPQLKVAGLTKHVRPFVTTSL